MSRLSHTMLALNVLFLTYIGYRLSARAYVLLPWGGADDAALHSWGGPLAANRSSLVGRLKSAAESGVHYFGGGGGATAAAGSALDRPAAGTGEDSAQIQTAESDSEWEWVWEYDGDRSEEEPGEELLRAQAKKKKMIMKREE